MDLCDKIGEILIGNEEGRRVSFSKSLRRFFVPDGGTDRKRLKVVLLLESPHTDEVKLPSISHRFPLAGRTGEDVYQELRCLGVELPDQLYSIGKLVHQGDRAVRYLGIMNVSPLPFQKGAYESVPVPCGVQDCRCDGSWDSYMECMETIRNGALSLRRECTRCQRMDEEISRDLKRRLESLYRRSRRVLLVPCGKVAAAFYLKAMVPYVPHPTHQAWRNVGCQQRKWLQELSKGIGGREPRGGVQPRRRRRVFRV